MKKRALRKTIFNLIQNFMAAFICLLIGMVLFHSYFSIQTMEGKKTYKLTALGSETVFEDSKLFNEIFRGAVKDVTRLVMIKEQLETGGEFDPHKKIDVNKFAAKRGGGNDLSSKIIFELEDLIKWGKTGVEYISQPMSTSQFVNYFGSATAAENFALDKDGQLYFAGFMNPKESTSVFTSVADKGRENLTEVEKIILEDYSTEQLEDMALSYIMQQNMDEINISKEDYMETVHVKLLNFRYKTVDGHSLMGLGVSWNEVIKAQRNIALTVEKLTESYQQYQSCHELYEEDAGNLKYAVRMMTNDGIKTYTNVPYLYAIDDEDITEYFSEFKRYMVYYPDSLVFMGNSDLTENDVYDFMMESDYAYPETTHIWIGVDTEYPIVDEMFYAANDSFKKIVPNIDKIIGACSVALLIWLVLTFYLTYTTGAVYHETDEPEYYLLGFDRFPIELWITASGFFVYGLRSTFLLLQEVVKDAQHMSIEQNIGDKELLVHYGYFFLFGFMASLCFSILWFSLARRVKCNNLWQDSLLRWIFVGLRRFSGFVLHHTNMVFNTIIPYLVFLLANLVGLFFVDRMNPAMMIKVAVLAGILIFDLIVGLMLFRKNAEQNDIVDGIRRIRDGEVEYKLEAEKLHGANKEMADAVNNIGEGIRNAVRTSVKDEQMKTDLITNVSHDIKTPLTSIINYVDLLKRLHIEDEPAKGYIEVLDAKAQRLKQLTDDLVEVSKISSGNIELNMEKINLTELLNQGIGEFSEKLEEKQLNTIFQSFSGEAYIYADSRRMWRVFENLFNNICKYAMEGTRVYVNLVKENDLLVVSIKNISKSAMNINADELTERFIRGDSSRSTEGSGLGLSIAKNLIQAQGGNFILDLDGDLFKVILEFKEYLEEEKDEDEEYDNENEIDAELDQEFDSELDQELDVTTDSEENPEMGNER